MKKILLFMSAVAMFAAASCNKAEIEGPQTETPSVNVSGDATEFVAYTESATKTALDGLNTVWVAGDEIDINESKYKATEAGAKSVFSLVDGEIPVAPYLAGYPYNHVYNNNTPEESTLYFDFSKTHALSAGKIGNEVLAIAYNKSEPSLEFKNVVSLIEFKVPAFAEDVTEIKISANEPMAGQICVNYNGGVPSWAADKDGELYNELILTSAENGKFEAGATYYVPVLPGQKTNLTVTINETVVATGLSIEFKRNVIHIIGTLPANEVKKVYLKPNIWNADGAWFAAHFWGNEGYADGIDIKMTDDDSNGIYEVAVPNGSKNVIFCRMNHEFIEFGWDVMEDDNVIEDHVWNQSSDLEIPTNDELYYVVNGWDTGAWKTYEEATAPPVIGLVGSFQGWNPEEPVAMTDNGDGWFVARGIELYKDDAFKFVENKSWDVNYGTPNTSAVLDVDQETEVTKDNGQNIMVSKNGKYDLFFNPYTLKVKAVCVEENTDIKVQISVTNQRTSWGSVNMYLWYEENGNKVDITTSPGPALIKNASGNYVYELDGRYIGETIYYVFSNNGADQTDQDNFTASRKGHSLTITNVPPAKFTMTLDTSTLTTYWGSTAYLYVWTDAPKVEPLGGWPGKKMTYNSSKKEFTCEIPSEYIGKKLNFIVHNGGGWQSADKVMNPVKAEQTYKGNKDLGLN